MNLNYKKNFKVGIYEVDFEINGKLIELSGDMHYIKEENGKIRIFIDYLTRQKYFKTIEKRKG